MRYRLHAIITGSSRILSICLLALLSFLPANRLWAGVTGKITGQVVDASSGEPLIGADVILVARNEGGTPVELSPSNRLGGATDEKGEYFIINISPGIYSIKFNYIGYQSLLKTNVRVLVDMTTDLDAQLNMTTIESGQTVTVTAQRSQVVKDLTSSQVSVGADQIEVMPVRGVNALIKLQAGVVEDAGGGIHIRGGRSSEITYMVDGVQVIDPLNRSQGMSIDDQAIAELKTITGTFNAEYGQALSGVVNIVTKRGSDEFRYNLTAYLGDYWSTDDQVYSLMTNEAWASAMGNAATGQLLPLISYAQEQGLNLTSQEAMEAQLAEKSHLTRKNYLSSYQPLQSKDLQLNFSGPIPGTKKRLTYFLSGRSNSNPGYRYGYRYFMPWGPAAANYVDAGGHLITLDAPDGDLTALNWYEGLSGVGKLYIELSQALRLSYGIYINQDHSYDVGYTYKYLPDAGRHSYTESSNQILSLKHTLSPRLFYELNYSYFDKAFKNYHYEAFDDPRYMPTNTSDLNELLYGDPGEGQYGFSPSVQDFNYYGNEVERSETSVNYRALKLDVTNQFNKVNLFKAGISARLNELDNDWVNMQFDDRYYRPVIPSENSPYRVHYAAKPREFAAYLQDKLEFDELIINLGLRFDYFDPDGRILADPMDPQIYDPFKLDHIYSNYTATTPDSELVEYSVAEREVFWWRDVEAKTQISPRFGVSFPITDRGVIHFSYGHFFQNPELRFLYDNPNFWIEGAGASPLVGNADLDAERTVMYEIGLQQELTPNVFLHITGFYRDIRGWVGTGAPIDTYSGLTYYKYENKDHAAAQGVTISNTYHFGSMNLNLDYTFMTAKGTSSDPRDAYNAAQNDEEPTLQLINLNWDQRQTFNGTFSYLLKGWSNTLVATLSSGLPYTPSFSRGEVSGSGTFVGLRENSARRPFTFNLDYRLARNFTLGGTELQVFLNVQNLLDRRNARNVYTDTGQADYTLEGVGRQDRIFEISDINEYYLRPENFSAPRYVQLGLRLSRR